MSKKTKDKAKRKAEQCLFDSKHSWCECTNPACGCGMNTCVMCGKKVPL